MKKNSPITVAAGAFLMLLLILDSETALAGASQGLSVCIRTVIPSLFPFFLLSGILTGARMTVSSPKGSLLSRVFHIPSGSGGLLIPAFLGGYPLGAQAVTQSHNRGLLSQPQARRLLGYCSNCGPAFLFGICGSLFTRRYLPWVLWLIHISSAAFVAGLLPQSPDQRPPEIAGPPRESKGLMEAALSAMGGVCGWVIVFRCLLALLERWFLWYLPPVIQVTVWGLAELANGCLALTQISSEPLRFVLASAFVSFGGLCVLLQTATVTKPLGLGLYIPGKLLQTALSLLFSAAFYPLLYPGSPAFRGQFLLALIPLMCIFLKKTVAFFPKPVYNTGK